MRHNQTVTNNVHETTMVLGNLKGQVVLAVVEVTLFPTKYMKTHMFNTFTVVNTQNVHMFSVSGCQKKPRLIELAAASALTWPSL